MLRCIPFFLAVASAVAAASSPADTGREAAFLRLRNDALATKLLDQAAEDIEAHRFEAALEKSEAAEAILPGNAVVLNTKGAALTELARFDEAARVLDAAVAADPTAFAPQFNQGQMLALQKKYSDAAVQFSVLKSRFGALPLLKYELYFCYALLGRKDLADAALLAMRYPEDGPAWYFAHAVDQLRAGKKREAERLIAAAEAIHGGDTRNYRDTLRESGLLP